MQYLVELFDTIVSTVLINSFGWVLFLWAGVFIWYKLRITSNQGRYYRNLKYIFLEVKIDQLNERSPFAMEQIFAALHAINTGFTWGERFAGKIVPQSSCEMVSLGGRVSYIFKIVERYRDLLESAIFAQYPKAEVSEVEDYLKNLPAHYNPETAEYDFWGTQMNKRRDHSESAYPIRTFGGFEHTEQKTIIDPLAGVIEVMSNIQPYELLAAQIVFKPVGEDWKKNAEEVVRKLRGNPKKAAKAGIFDAVLMFPFAVLSQMLEIIVPKPPVEVKTKTKEELPSQMMHLSEGQKQVVSACEHMLSKISYECKVRLLYLAPKNKFNKGLRLPQIIGAYRNFDDPSLNGMKPDLRYTWTGATYRFSEALEKPLRSRQELTKKRHFLTAFKKRDHWMGSGKAYYNTEELASIFHFPQTPNARVSQVEKVETVKTAPPANLPIGEI